MYTTLVSATQLQVLQNDCCIFDCRFSLADVSQGLRVYLEGHIPGAVYLDLNKDLSSQITAHTGRHPLPDAQKLLQILQATGVKEGVQVVVYDDAGGAMAARAWWLLRWLGHTQVAVLDGGLPAWQAAGFPLATGVQNRTITATDNSIVKPFIDEKQVVTTQEVVTNLTEHTFQLVDARSRERFMGDVEPIDPVAGHIPGALNRPLSDNLRQGFFKPAAELRQEWLTLLQGTEPESVVHMCGSGVTACHNQLAMAVADLPGSRVYTGSWSEWIRDPQRPIATDME